MFLKRRINLILSLCLIALTSVGFSSWVITAGPTTITGTIETDYVINSSDYIKLDSNNEVNSYNGLKKLMFNKEGFLIDNPNYNDPTKTIADKVGIEPYTYTNTGTIQVWFYLDVPAFNAKFGSVTNTNAKLYITITSVDEINLFNNKELISVDANAWDNSGENKIGKTTTNNDSSLEYEINVKDMKAIIDGKNYYFSIEYKFTISGNEEEQINNFKSVFGDNRDTLKFKFQTKLVVS